MSKSMRIDELFDHSFVMLIPQTKSCANKCDFIKYYPFLLCLNTKTHIPKTLKKSLSNLFSALSDNEQILIYGVVYVLCEL